MSKSTSLIKIVNTFCIKETDLDFKFYFVMLSAMVILFRSLSVTHWLKQNGKRRKLLWKCRHIRRITKLRVYACVCVCECECVDVLVKWHVFKSVDVIYSILLHRTYRTNHFDFISLHCIQSQSRSLSFSLSSHLLNFHSFILCSLPIKTRLIMCWKAPHTQIHCGLFTFLHQTHTQRIEYIILWLKWMGQQNEIVAFQSEGKKHTLKCRLDITPVRRKPSRKKTHTQADRQTDREFITLYSKDHRDLGENKTELLNV